MHGQYFVLLERMFGVHMVPCIFIDELVEGEESIDKSVEGEETDFLGRDMSEFKLL